MVTLAILSVCFVVGCVFSIRSFLNAWATGRWDQQYWDTFLLQTFLPMFMLATQIPLTLLKLATSYSPKQVRAALSVVRGVAADGAGTLASVDVKLRERLHEEPVVDLPTRFEGLSRPTRDLELNYLLGGGAALAIALACPVIALAVAILAGPAGHVPLIVELCIGSAALGIWGTRNLLRGLRLGRHVTIEAETWGIRVTLPEEHARELSIAWHEARSFFTLRYWTEWQSGDHHVFVLDTDGAAIVWKVAARDASEIAETSDSLCALIAARTGLVPHDLTDVAAQITTARWKPAYARMFDTIAANSSAIGNEALSRAVRLMPRPARFRTVIRPAMALMFALLLVPALLAGASIGAEHYQSSYYDALLQRIHTHTPLYRDSLTAADADWQVHEPTTEDQRLYTFEGGNYQIGGATTDNFDHLISLAPGVYDNAAIEVTARQYGGPDYLGIGLIIRGSASDEVVFSVSPSGMWHFARYGSAPNDGLSVFSFQGSGYVHTSVGAANRLSIIARGSDYICYINGEFVGAIHDRLVPAGRAGVIVETDGTMTGAFTDFSVYPV